MLFLELLKKIFGTRLRMGLELFQQPGPDGCKGVGLGTPGPGRSFSLPMCRSYFALLPSRPEALQKSFCSDSALWFRRGTLFRSHEFLLPGTDLWQELHRIEHRKSSLQLLLGGLWDLIGSEQALVGRSWCVILFRDFRSLARLRFQFERGLKEVDIAAGGFVQRTQRFGGFHARKSAIADELPNDRSILLLHPGLIVLAVRPGAGKLQAGSPAVVQNRFVDECTVVIRIETA